MKNSNTAGNSHLSIEEEELRGISRSIAEIEWLLLSVVLLYYVFGGTAPGDKAVITLAMVCLLYTSDAADE